MLQRDEIAFIFINNNASWKLSSYNFSNDIPQYVLKAAREGSRLMKRWVACCVYGHVGPGYSWWGNGLLHVSGLTGEETRLGWVYGGGSGCLRLGLESFRLRVANCFFHTMLEIFEGNCWLLMYLNYYFGARGGLCPNTWFLCRRPGFGYGSGTCHRLIQPFVPPESKSESQLAGEFNRMSIVRLAIMQGKSLLLTLRVQS